MSNFLQPHGLQHTRLPCPSPSPRACSNSCPLSRWSHPTISSSVTPFSSCFQSFQASGSFLMSWLLPCSLDRPSPLSEVLTTVASSLISVAFQAISVTRSKPMSLPHPPSPCTHPRLEKHRKLNLDWPEYPPGTPTIFHILCSSNSPLPFMLSKCLGLSRIAFL